MNFAEVRKVKGQKDAQDPRYDLKIVCCGRFGDSFASSLTKTSKPQCKIKLTDDTGETHNVNIFGADQPTAAMTHQRAQFRLCAFDGVHDGKAYESFSGFWDSGVFVDQGQQPAPQGQQQPYQQPTTQGAQSSEPPTRDATGVSIERQCVVKAVGEVYRGYGDKVDLGKVIKLCCYLHQWVTDGKDVPTMAPTQEPANWDDPGPSANVGNPNYDPNRPPPPTDSAIPF